MPNSDPSSSEPLRSRNKTRIRHEIASAAVQLAIERGLSSFSADDIATAAEVGRATFFRYFDSKESAVVVGFYENRLTELVAMLGQAPEKLGPVDALIWSYRQLAGGFERDSMLLRLLDNGQRLIRLGLRAGDRRRHRRALRRFSRRRPAPALAGGVHACREHELRLSLGRERDRAQPA